MGIKHAFNSAKADGVDATKVRPTNWNTDHTIDGDVDFGGHALTNIEDEAYNQTAWNGSLSVPTKNAIRDKIEALVLTGGGVTDFLALDDTPDAYADLGRSFARVNTAENALEFKYSTGDHLDIRDYGTIADGDDITAALDAALIAKGVDLSLPRRIRIPKMGSLGFSLDPAALTGVKIATIWEIDALVLELKSTLTMAFGMSIYGRASQASATFLSDPAPRPIIRAHSTATLDPTVSGAGNIHLENVAIAGDASHAFKIDQTNLFTIKNCVFSTDAAATALLINQCFWGNIEHIFCSPRAAGDQYCMEITNSIDHGPGGGTDCGLLRFKDLRCDRNGIYISASYGPTGTNNIIFEDVLAENMQIAGSSLFTFESGADGIGTAGVTQIELYRTEVADSPLSYIIKNLNTNNTTTSITYEGRNESTLVDPASDPIKEFIVNHHVRNPLTNAITDLTTLYAGSDQWNNWKREYPTSLDCRLLTTPVGVPWVPGPNLAVVQSPASWTNLGGATITTPILGPDGSTNAGTVSGGSGARCYTGSHTLAVGDWIIAGIWMRRASASLASRSAKVKLATSGFEYNGSTAEPHFAVYIEDAFVASGWHWYSVALKITAIGTNPCTVNFDLSDNGFGCDYFNPCMVLVPEADAFEDAWGVRLARSLKGGWSSSGIAGDVAFLDHQRVYAGSGLNMKDGVTAPTSKTGVAQIYVDTADGDLKVMFGDGTIKTIVVDT